MQMHLEKSNLAQVRTPLLCVPLFENEGFRARPLTELDAACGGLLSAVSRTGDFTGKLWSHVTLYNPSDTGPSRVLLLGVGDPKDFGLERVRQAAARAAQRAIELRVSDLAIVLPTTRISGGMGSVAQAIVEGCVLGAYRYDDYLTAREDRKQDLESVKLVAVRDVDSKEAQAGMERGAILGEVVCSVRDMVNAPGGELTPTELGNRAARSAKAHGFGCRVLEKREIERLGMRGLLAVSQGSNQPPRFIILEYNGADAKSEPYLFVGKGLTFDAGGLCLKPASKMDEMKGDMAGGAATIGAVEAAARLGIPARVVGLVPASENLLGGSAYRPGDILRMMGGQTVVVDNTDAEGRIILADALVYANRYKPRAIIDMATLTGAALVALGQVATAVLGNDRSLVQKLQDAGDRSFERLWELPLWPEFKELIRSPIADIKNSGGRHAGTITAAAFLQHFVGETPWAHLDIAGTAYLDKADGYRPQAATGVGVRLLTEFLDGEVSRPVTRKVRTSSKGRSGRRRRAPAAGR